MSVTSAIVLFITVWTVIFFMYLPRWQQSQSQSGEIVPGTPGSAPVDPKLGKKAFRTTLWAIPIFIGLYSIIEYEVVTLEDIPFFTPPSLRDQ